jgi:hypothetical protein
MEAGRALPLDGHQYRRAVVDVKLLHRHALRRASAYSPAILGQNLARFLARRRCEVTR